MRFLHNQGGGRVVNQCRAAMSGSMCYAIMGASVGWPSPTLIKMEKGTAPVTLDVHQISWMVSLLFLGNVVSPLPTARLMDRLGRQRTCLLLSILPLISWLLVYLASSPLHLYVARFAAGLWNGVTTTVGPIYVCEVSEPGLRNSLATFNIIFVTAGAFFVYVIGPHVSYHVLALVCGILTLTTICALATVPESPYHFMLHGEKAKTFEVLNWFRRGESKENIDKEIERIAQSLEEQKLHKGTIKDIVYDRGNMKALTVAITFGLLRSLSGIGVLQAYISVTMPDVSLGVLDPDTCVIIFGVGALTSAITTAFLSAKFNRRILLTVSCLGCTIATVTVGVWYYLNDFTTISVMNYSDLVFASFLLYFTVINIGIGPHGTRIKGEMFSLNVKGLSSSLTSMSTAAMGFVANRFYLIIAHTIGMYVNFIIISVALIVTLVFTWIYYVPNTHNKSLEEIRIILKGSDRNSNYTSSKNTS